MAYTTINKPSLHFNTKLYTGNGAVTTHTGLGFQPDWCWIKDRTQANHNNNLIDAVRAAPNIIMSDSTAAQITDSTDGFTAFASDGFTLGANTSGTQSYELNKNGNNYVAWNWKANGVGSSNSDGSITSTVSANTTAGFSIVKYTGTGSNATIGHGLGVAPSMIIIKNLTSGRDWLVYHKELGNTHGIYLDLTNASTSSSGFFNNTSPTSSVFSVGTDTDANDSSDNTIAYCFAEKTGYSKFGSYTGNGSTNGTFVFCGFRPAWVMSKRSDSSDGWRIRDAKRDIDNPAQHRLLANASDAEVSASSQDTDFLSNGFKIRNSDSGYNGSGATYIYMAFGQSIVGSNNIPANAR